MKALTDPTTILITNPEGPGTIIVSKRSITTKDPDERLAELGPGGVFGVNMSTDYLIVVTEK